MAQAADEAGAMTGMFPTDGSLRAGAHVRAVFSESFGEHLKKFTESVQKLTPEKRAAYMENLSWERQPAYDADIWPNKEDYDKLVEAWRQVKIQPVTLVGVGMQKLDSGLWRLLSVTEGANKQQVPLTISALNYDAEHNVWISGNGTLKATEYTTPADSIYGAQTGTEWSLEKKDSLTHMRETIRVSKTTDGKFVYLAYSLVEQSAVTGKGIASGAYLLQFPVQTTGANLGTPGQR